MAPQLDESDLARLREFCDKAKRLREELRNLDLDSLIQHGVLTPLGRGWYEVPGKVHDLPEALGFIATEAGTSASGRPMIKLPNPGAVLKALDRF